MITHNLPFDEKWQLLTPPIQKTQFMEMPELSRTIL
jgi:hypothetical protein